MVILSVAGIASVSDLVRCSGFMMEFKASWAVR
jgi:hypothetical protein